MNVAAGVALVTVVGLGTPAAFFLWQAIPLRRERPELLRNGLCFMLPFVIYPVTWYFSLIIAPTALVVVIISLRLLSGQKKSSVFYVALGEVCASVLGMGMLTVVNTYLDRQR